MLRYLFLLLFILLVKAAVMAGVILYAGIGLSPDEAQYWTWSQALDWGYYSKPPGIAWEIWAGTKLFGNTEFGIRFIPLLIGFILPILIYFLSLQCRLQPKTAFWAALIMAFTPLGVAASFFATTDGSMVLFWTFALMVFLPALRDQKTPNYYLLGLVIAFGALFKWPIYLFWFFVLMLLPFFPFLRQLGIFAGLFISLMGLFPSVVWNASHNWATFRHVSATIQGGGGEVPASHGNFWEFVGAQAGFFSPILFILLLISAFYLIKMRREIPLHLFFCGAMCFIIIFGIAFASIFKKMQGNWGVFAYPSGIVFLAWLMLEKIPWGKLWIQIGVGISVLILALAILIPYAQRSGIAVPYKLHLFKHTVGWDNLAEALKEDGYDPAKDFLFGDRYQTTSILSFYGENQKRAYFLNLRRIRHNQFSYWPGMPEEQIGKTGYFVVIENKPYLFDPQKQHIEEYKKMLAEYFKDVEYLGIKPLFTINNEVVKGALIFKATNYNGKKPAETLLY